MDALHAETVSMVVRESLITVHNHMALFLLSAPRSELAYDKF